MLRPEEAKSLFERRSATVGTPAMAELDREMTPILAEVMAVGRFLILEVNEDPAATKLFDWLLDSKRTGEEFLLYDSRDIKVSYVKFYYPSYIWKYFFMESVTKNVISGWLHSIAKHQTIFSIGPNSATT